jgi:hypothetical protein
MVDLETALNCALLGKDVALTLAGNPSNLEAALEHGAACATGLNGRDRTHTTEHDRDGFSYLCTGIEDPTVQEQLPANTAAEIREMCGYHNNISSGAPRPKHHERKEEPVVNDTPMLGNSNPVDQSFTSGQECPQYGETTGIWHDRCSVY